MSAKTLERIHLLRMLDRYGEMHGASLADRANEECDHELLDTLPLISRRGIGQKLGAMSLAGLLYGYPDGEGLTIWGATAKGLELARSLPDEGWAA